MEEQRVKNGNDTCEEREEGICSIRNQVSL